MLNICICGGGNLSHAFLGYLNNKSQQFHITLITRQPEKWSQELEVYQNNTRIYKTNNYTITSQFDVLTKADIIILTLPCHVRFQYLSQIKQYISPQAIILTAPSLGGINFFLDKHFPLNKYACCQRVPFICRTIKYGQSVNIDIKKKQEIYYSSNCSVQDEIKISKILQMPIHKLQSYWPLMLSNSNPIIHIARICEILDTQYPCSTPPLFYESWGDKASSLALNMDKELAIIMQRLKVKEYRNLLQHYEVNSLQELTKKINSIPSFQKILAPMIPLKDKYILDKQSRYITEDLSYGTCFIKYLGNMLRIKTPYIDYAIKKLQPFLNSKFLETNGKFNTHNWEKYIGTSLDDIIPQNIMRNN